MAFFATETDTEYNHSYSIHNIFVHWENGAELPGKRFAKSDGLDFSVQKRKIRKLLPFSSAGDVEANRNFRMDIK
jgi:hypothetical protein